MMVENLLEILTNTGNASSSSFLISLNNSEEKDPQSFLKDLRINSINRLIIGQLNIILVGKNLSNYLPWTVETLIYSWHLKLSSTKLFQQRSFCYKFFACLMPYENFLLLGDFNAEMKDPSLKESCNLYSLKYLIKNQHVFKIQTIQKLLICY